MRRTIIYKIHGSVVRSPTGDKTAPAAEWDDSYVITEEDYVEFLSRMTYTPPVPAVLLRYFKQSQFLFLGYGLNDWNLRVLLHSIRGNPVPERKRKEEQTGAEQEYQNAGDNQTGRGKERASWAIQKKPTLIERKLWEKRQVTIFDVDINRFVEKLSAATPLMPSGAG
jgi:hypothetical protein